MSGLMQRENATLNERVTGLSWQVQSLSEQLNAAERCQQYERAQEHRKALEAGRVQRQKSYNGPSLS